MNLLSGPEIKVGALVVLISGIIAVMSFKVAQGPAFFSGSKEYSFDVEDAGGLVENSAAKMAGIKVGVIDRIELVNGRARVFLTLNDDVPLTSSSYVTLKSDGILGDRHVELVPGRLQDPPLKDKAVIQYKDSRGSIDGVLAEVGEIASSLKEVAKNLNQATKADGDASTILGRIVINIEKLTKDLSEVTGENKDQIRQIVKQVSRITKSLDDVLSSDGPEGFKAVWANTADSVRNIEEITDKVNSGEGTIGRLINDEETVESLNTAISSVNDFLGGANKLETSFDFHTEALLDIDETKSFLNVKIKPGLDRYYLIGVVDDPDGVTKTVETTSTVGSNDPVTTTDVKTFKNKIKFTALFAKNFYDFTVKGGIFENAGGVGFDYHFMRRRLKFSVEAFDFEDLYLRSFLKYDFFKGVYVIGGADNILDRDDEFSSFIGAGIFITNEDLKIFASRVSF